MATNILVIIDPEEETHTALNRIREIPPTADVVYKVDFYLDAVPVMAEEATPGVIKDAIAKHAEWLDELVAPLRGVGYQITTEVIPFNKLFEEILKSAKAFNADFIFKPVRQHGTLRRLFFTPTDWNLIRLCPHPLLMVSDKETVRDKPVVAAVDVGDSDEAHQRLNNAVLERALQLAQTLEADVHVIYANGPAAVAGRAGISDQMAVELARGKYEEELSAAVALAKKYGIEEGNVQLREGVPRKVLNDYAGEVDASVIVLGTVARAGASGLLVGNTAEGVLEAATTDVFVVKLPED